MLSLSIRLSVSIGTAITTRILHILCLWTFTTKITDQLCLTDNEKIATFEAKWMDLLGKKGALATHSLCICRSQVNDNRSFLSSTH